MNKLFLFFVLISLAACSGQQGGGETPPFVPPDELTDPGNTPTVTIPPPESGPPADCQGYQCMFKTISPADGAVNVLKFDPIVMEFWTPLDLSKYSYSVSYQSKYIASNGVEEYTDPSKLDNCTTETAGSDTLITKISCSRGFLPSSEIKISFEATDKNDPNISAGYAEWSFTMMPLINSRDCDLQDISCWFPFRSPAGGSTVGVDTLIAVEYRAPDITKLPTDPANAVEIKLVARSDGSVVSCPVVSYSLNGNGDVSAHCIPQSIKCAEQYDVTAKLKNNVEDMWWFATAKCGAGGDTPTAGILERATVSPPDGAAGLVEPQYFIIAFPEPVNNDKLNLNLVIDNTSSTLTSCGIYQVEGSENMITKKTCSLQHITLGCNKLVKVAATLELDNGTNETMQWSFRTSDNCMTRVPEKGAINVALNVKPKVTFTMPVTMKAFQLNDISTEHYENCIIGLPKYGTSFECSELTLQCGKEYQALMTWIEAGSEKYLNLYFSTVACAPPPPPPPQTSALTVNVGGGGTVTCEGSLGSKQTIDAGTTYTGTYSVGEEVRLTAVPDSSGAGVLWMGKCVPATTWTTTVPHEMSFPIPAGNADCTILFQ